VGTIVDARKIRVQNRAQRQQQLEEAENVEEEENDSRAQPAIQYYRAEPKQDSQQNVILVANDDDYNGYYGQPTQRSRSDYRPAVKATTQAPRVKQQESRQPPVQTLRNYNKVNDDGSFTFGYEAADGSFKEETRGTDCVVRGKYGYIDPDGNKREFTYVSGNPCDPNNPDGEEEEEPSRSEEDADENIPQNYPRRPIAQRPVTVRPLPTTTRQAAPTTVFQNTYASSSRRPASDEEEEEDDEQTVQIGQRPTARPSARPFVTQQASPTPTQRPRVQVVNTTPVAPVSVYQQPTHAVSITPRPHRINTNPSHQRHSQPPATTYRPQVQYVSTAAPAYQQQSAEYSSFPSSTPSAYVSSTKSQQQFTKTSQGSVDFESEFKKFQQENYVTPTTTPVVSTAKPFKPSPLIKMEVVGGHPGPQHHQPQHQAPQQVQGVTGNPIYQSQLVFDPATGQYDTQLYQQVPQGDGEFTLNHRIQPYVQQQQQPQIHHQPQLQHQPQLVALEQLQPAQPLQQGAFHQNTYRHQPAEAQRHEAPVPQQLYQQQHKEVQFVNSQQLFAQQLELQQAQLHRDRAEASKKPHQSHRFGGVPVAQRQVQNPLHHGQQFYYLQPQAGQLSQIDQFLRGQHLQQQY
jgi:Insect cuticle protein